MPNVIKYTTGSTPSGSLRRGNMLIGNGTADYGLTYYTGITPPSGGYTVYLNKASGGPSIYCPVNDSQLVSLTNGIAGSNYTTAAQCLDYFEGQSDKLCVNRDLEGVVTNGLVLYLDAGFTPSYPTTGTTWYDLSGNSINGTLTNGPSFNSSNGGNISTDGTNDYIDLGTPSALQMGTGNFTINVWVKIASPQPVETPGANFHPIIDSKNAAAAEAGYGIVWNAQYDKFLWSTGNGSSASEIFSTNSWTALKNTWANVVMIRQNGSTNNGCFYINSVYEPLASTASVLNVNTTTKTLLGNTADLYGQYWSKMTYGVVQVYNRALTAAEVLQNYNAQKSRYGL